MNINDAVKELQSIGKVLTDKGLTWGNAGNISIRTGEDRYLISASGTCLGELENEDFVECSIKENNTLYGFKKPSKETPMHRAIYETRPDIHSVLHASPFYSTMLACTNMEVPTDWFVEDMYYLERVERIPYFHPGSSALGEAVREKTRKTNIILLENHGVIVYDINTTEAEVALQTLENVCRMLIMSKCANLKMNALSGETVENFLNNSGYRKRREWDEK
jgi:3-dehydro-4-phosphotetronate decarboxylase